MTSTGPLEPDAEADPGVDVILDAALEVYADFGIARATLDDIARRAKVRRGTVYRRVGGKSEVVTAVMIRESTRLFETIRKAASSATTDVDRVVNAFATTVTTVRENRVWNRVLELEPGTILDQLTINGSPILAAAIEATADVLRNPASGLSDECLRAQAEIMVRITHSILLTPHAFLPLATYAELASFAQKYLFGLINPAVR